MADENKDLAMESIQSWMDDVSDGGQETDDHDDPVGASDDEGGLPDTKMDPADDDEDAVGESEPTEEDDDQDEEVEDQDQDDSGATDGDDQGMVNELLAEIRALRDEVSKLKGEKPEDTPELRADPELTPLQLDEQGLAALREKHGEVIDSLVLPLANQLNAAIESINSIKTQQQEAVVAQQQEMEIQQYLWATKEMDKLSEKFPSLGKTDELPVLPDGTPNMADPRNQARANIYERAVVAWYKGQKAEVEVKRQVVKELNGRKKRFTGRPTKKKTKDRKLSGDALKEKVISDAFKNAGIE